MKCDLIHGDALTELRKLPDESVQCVVTSPPYWGLRDYGTAEWEGGNDPKCNHMPPDDAGKSEKQTDGQRNHAGRFSGNCRKCGATRIDSQLGLEATPEEYVANMVEVFREVRRVLRSDGVAWVNMGDTYNSPNTHSGPADKVDWSIQRVLNAKANNPRTTKTLKPKDLVGIPWRLAFALQADGWWLRQDIVWSKPNPMPESVTDRCTKSHEYIFLLTKAARYYYDADAIKEPAVYDGQPGDGRIFGGRNKANGVPQDNRRGREWEGQNGGRNRRSVWTIATEPYPEAHFATFPTKLVEPCILAGSKEGDTVLDPFCGSATVGYVALRAGRAFIGIDLKAEYLDMAKRRISLPLFIP